MKRIGTMLAVVALAIALIVISLVPAQANHTPAHTQRRINRLQNQVSTLKDQVASLRSDVRFLNADVNALLHDVFDCQILVDPPEQFADGLFYHDLYYSGSCATAASPSAKFRDSTAHPEVKIER